MRVILRFTRRTDEEWSCGYSQDRSPLPDLDAWSCALAPQDAPQREYALCYDVLDGVRWIVRAGAVLQVSAGRM